ncbi:MAG: hypothetical protein NTV30_11215, partial [Chloroflexi bacterium]|nr:hypothetical protein [Chloroflexota bacterium]
MNLNLDELKRGGIVALREKDMFSIWVKTACCNLTSNQLRKIADITDEYAQGFILFTSRQIPIIPFVNIKDIHKVKEELGKVELDLDHCGARVRNLNVCYDDKVCHKAIVNCISLGEKLERFFSNDLKHKVKIGAAGCNEDCIMSRALNDISFVGVQDNGITGYDAHIGGRLGLNPFLGVKIADCISENNCVQLVSNYFDLLRQEGKPGERSADLVKRIGLDRLKLELNKGLHNVNVTPAIDCIKIKDKDTAKIILKIKATCGEVTTGQVRKIASIADESGYGFVHFTVRGSPEIPGIDREKVPGIENKLNECDLQLIRDGMDNIQSCFGAYCTESLADPQSLLKKLETKINKLGLNHSNLSFSASGCPNSCGIAHLSDIG